MNEKKSTSAKAPKGKEIEGAPHKTEYAAKEGILLTKEEIRKFLIKDLRGVYITFAEILNSPESIDALVDVFHAKAEKLAAQKAANPELFKDAN